MEKTRGFELVEGGKFLPNRATQYSAGYDLYSNEEEVVLLPGETKIVKTGVAAYMQKDEWLAIHLRSSLATKKGLMLGNGVGVVDMDFYPNEIGVILHNPTSTEVAIGLGDRIAQGVFQKYLLADNDTAEGVRDSGFGSTGA